MAVTEHKGKAHRVARCAIITASDTRTEETDTSGQKIKDLLAAHNHPVVSYQILKDEPLLITNAVRALLDQADVDAIMLNGGTGIAPRDSTFEAIQGLLEKEISGFGELFRMLSYQDIGSAAMMTRATAGVAKGKVVISLPGSTGAVELGMTKLVIPELGHMLFLLRGERHGH
ncbi:MAG: MogA/MoaB family molybdenum cofactor biosynthesis protein [Deltaproteobacteria bacterium]|nr:MogA/MoaB family molybdenum cofactor biosynthesis protein [Deltaproteobacteria bacterium]